MKKDSRIELCVLWPVPRWGELGHYPVHLLPWFFRTDIEGGFGARLKEHQGQVSRWQGNTVVMRDGDYLRYSARLQVESLGPALQSLRVHFEQLAQGKLVPGVFEGALADERQFQVRRSLSASAITGALDRASSHDKPATDGLDIPLQLDRVTPKALSALAAKLRLEGAIIGVVGPAAAVKEALGKAGLKPTNVIAAEPSERSEP